MFMQCTNTQKSTYKRKEKEYNNEIIKKTPLNYNHAKKKLKHNRIKYTIGTNSLMEARSLKAQWGA